MAIIHGVVRAADRDQANTWLHKHGWVGDVRPVDDNDTLDLMGGGNQTFSDRLVRVSNPSGAVVAYGFNGWRLTAARASLLRTAIGQTGWAVSRLGTEQATDQFVWWTQNDDDFPTGIARMVVPLQVQEVAI